MKIREMEKADLPQLAGLYRQFWQENADLARMEKQFDVLSRQDTHILLSAVDKEMLAGSVMGVVCGELYGDCRPFLVLENMIVDSAYRHKGVGRALLQALEERAKARSCTQIILVTEAEREDACAFYEACGFQLNNRGFKKKL